MAFCTNCGSETATAFCPNCGTGNNLVENANVATSLDANVISSAQPVANVTPPAGIKAPKNKVLLIAIPLAIIGAIMIAVFLAAPKNPFPNALDACGISEDDSYIYLGDEGKTLLMNGDGKETYGADSTDVWCVLEALNVPESTVAQMEKTSSLMGVVSDSWDGITADWTYHPDDGFDVVLKFEN